MKQTTLMIILSISAFMIALSGCSMDNDEERLNQKIESRLNALHVSAASISVFDEGGVIWSNAFGRLSTAGEQNADEDTIFKLASLTKVITGIAVMQLYERGQIDLDRDVSSYLPFSVRHPGYPETPVTMQMLLTHSSGIRDNWTVIEGDLTSYDPAAKKIPDLSETCTGYFTTDGEWYDEKLNFTGEGPGGITEYSNMGITLAGLIVEEVSGISFEDYCRLNIFVPAGISGGWNLLPQQTANMAHPADYNYDDVAAYTGSAYPAGFYCCSSGDFAALSSIFLNGGLCGGSRLLEKETAELMLRMQSGDFCYIWKPAGFTYDGEHLIHHTGGMAGTRTGVFLSLENRIGAVILTSGEFDFPYTYYDIIKTLIDFGRTRK